MDRKANRRLDLTFCVIDYALLTGLLIGNAILVFVLAMIFPIGLGTFTASASILLLVRWINRRNDKRPSCPP
jgi:hypothetical protein